MFFCRTFVVFQLDVAHRLMFFLGDSTYAAPLETIRIWISEDRSTLSGLGGGGGGGMLRVLLNILESVQLIFTKLSDF